MGKTSRRITYRPFDLSSVEQSEKGDLDSNSNEPSVNPSENKFTGLDLINGPGDNLCYVNSVFNGITSLGMFRSRQPDLELPQDKTKIFMDLCQLKNRDAGHLQSFVGFQGIPKALKYQRGFQDDPREFLSGMLTDFNSHKLPSKLYF